MAGITLPYCQILKDLDATRQVAQQFAKSLKPGDVVALCGPLGAGKTTWMRSMVEALIGYETAVSSPTFSYLNIYEGHISIYHFDLYRLPGPSAFVDLGLEDFLTSKGICCIEWPERLGALLPPCWQIQLTPQSPKSRLLNITHT